MRKRDTLSILAVSNNKLNKTRSALIMISIALTTMLLTVIGLMGNGYVKSNKANVERLYGAFCGKYSNINETQLANVKLRSEFSEIGIQAMVAEVQSQNASLSLYYMDDVALQMTQAEYLLMEGSYPEEENEITAQMEFFKELGYENPKVGDTIQLEGRVDQHHKYETHSFVIAGITASNEANDLRGVYGAFVTEPFYRTLIPEEDAVFSVLFQINESISLNSSNAKEMFQELATACGIDPLSSYENSMYLLWAKEPAMDIILGCIGIACFVILFSVIVIYNIFQVGLVQKIQEYGKIKALGATKKQMKQLVFQEGMSLAVLAIPVGLILGNLVTIGVFHWQMQFAGQVVSVEGYEDISLFSVPIALLVIVLVLITVSLALYQPMKIVSRVSPVEALRYQESLKEQKGLRRGKRSLKLIHLTLANLQSNQKRTIATIVTMGLSCVLFVVLSNLTANMDAEYEAREEIEYGRFLIGVDYSLNDTAYPENNLYNLQKDNPINEELMEQIKAIPGVTEVLTRKVITTLSPNGEQEYDSISILNREEFKKYAENENSFGALHYDEVTSNQGIVFGWGYFLESDGYELGEQLVFELQINGQSIPFQAVLSGSFARNNQDWVITEDTYKKLGIDANTETYLWIECDEKDEDTVLAALNQLLASRDHLELSTYTDAYHLAEVSMQSLKTIIYAFLAIIGVIGFLNMANTIITSIITRKRELGILQAIGMTNHQLNAMLQLEGLLFTLGTVIVAIVVGCPVGYLAFISARKNGIYGLNIYQFPWREMVCMILVITVLQMVLSFLLTRNLRKDSLVERIRYFG